MRWGNLIFLIIFIGIPLASKVLQSLQDKRVAERDRKRRQEAASRVSSQSTEGNIRGLGQADQGSGSVAAADMRLPGTRSIEDERRSELARRRAAQLAEWRAKQAMTEGATEDSDVADAMRGLQARVGGVSSMSDPLSSPTGAELVRSLRVQAEERARRQAIGEALAKSGRQQQRTGSGSRPSGGRGGTTLTEHQRQQHAAGSESETTVHRLVLSDEELAIQRGEVVRKSPGAGDGQLMPVDPAAIFNITRSREALRQAYVMKEILDAPLALRQEQR